MLIWYYQQKVYLGSRRSAIEICWQSVLRSNENVFDIEIAIDSFNINIDIARKLSDIDEISLLIGKHNP